MEIFLAIVGLFIAGLVGTSRAAYRFRRNRVMTALVGGGWISVLAGVLVGPEVTGLITRETLYNSIPLLTIGLGWIGFIVGFQVRIGLLKQIRRRVYATVALDTATSIFVFGVLAVLGLRFWASDITAAETWLPLALIVAASLGWKMELRSLGLNRNQAAALAVRVTGTLLGVIAVLMFGLATKFVGRDSSGEGLFLPGTGGLRVLHTFLLAVSVGIVGRILIRLAGNRFGHQLAVFLGIVAFTSGSAKQIDVSPLIATMLAGFVFANIKVEGLAAFERFIFRAEHTMLVLFGMLAGIMLDPSFAAPSLLLVAAILVARTVAKPMILRIAIEKSDDAESRYALGLAGVRQSPLMLVLGVSLLLVEPSAFHKQVIWVLVLVGLFSELVPAIMGVAHHRSRDDEHAGVRAEPGAVT